MKNETKRSTHLKDIIAALNQWAMAPKEGTNAAKLQRALREYQEAVKADTYLPIAWEFAYPRNTLSKKQAPGEAFGAFFSQPEAVPEVLAVEDVTVESGSLKAPWED